jgi:hypothetical protein
LWIILSTPPTIPLRLQHLATFFSSTM